LTVNVHALKVLLIHNHYGGFSGESSVLEAHEILLKRNGHDVRRFTRSSDELKHMQFGMVRAFFAALYNPYSNRAVSALLKEFQPDLVHIHNLYPLLSPSVLPVIAKAGVPVVMTVHNYRLICPNGLFYNREGICERCKGGKEWNCFLHNCEQSIPKSLGYALRNIWARLSGYYSEHVNAFLCLTQFQKRKLVENGFPAARCYILPNFTEQSRQESDTDDIPFAQRKGFLFIGRLNRQKGIDVLLKTAMQCPDLLFILAGSSDPSFADPDSFPSNVRWLGVIGEEEKLRVLRHACALVFTSRSYEGFPMVFLEAMQAGLPVVAPNLAGYPEIIRDGENGWLFRPEDSGNLAEILQSIQENPGLAEKFGNNARNILREEYSSEVWYNKYIDLANLLLQNRKRM